MLSAAFLPWNAVEFRVFRQAAGCQQAWLSALLAFRAKRHSPTNESAGAPAVASVLRLMLGSGNALSLSGDGASAFSRLQCAPFLGFSVPP